MKKDPQKPAPGNIPAPARSDGREYTVSREFLDLLPELLIACTTDGVIEVANQKTCEVLQRKESALLRSSVFALCAESKRDVLRAAMDSCLAGGTPVSIETQLLVPGHEAADVELTVREFTLVRGGDARHVVIMGECDVCVVDQRGVFDGVDAGENRLADRLRAMGMGCNLASCGVRNLYDRGDFVRRHFGLARHAAEGQHRA